MKAYKCDVCGKMYEKRNGISIKARNDTCYIFEEYAENRAYCADICPDCTSAIQKVIDERSKENG